MPKPVRLESEATLELDEAIARYERERPGLGYRSAAAVDAALAKAADTPERWSLDPSLPSRLDVRRVLVESFPYAVLYLDQAEAVHVVAIAHFRRRPGYWLRRT